MPASRVTECVGSFAGWARRVGFGLLAVAAVNAASAAGPVPFANDRPGSNSVYARFSAAGENGEELRKLSGELRLKALGSQRSGSADAAEWWSLFLWADLLGRDLGEEVKARAEALKAGRSAVVLVGSAGGPSGKSAAGVLDVPTRDALTRDAAFRRSFQVRLSPMDDLPAVLGVLNSLEKEEPGWRVDRRELGIAVAVVLDTSVAPPWWPHSQVPPSVLSRNLPEPLEAFRWWSREGKAGRLLFDPRRLGADELRFVVASALTPAERDWVIREKRVPLGRLPQLYSEIEYDSKRIDDRDYGWPHADYRLATIGKKGGICVDQAYHGSEIAKALGVPALLFAGQGSDGRHAWFGYLAGSTGWKLDVGRGADARLVSGQAIDPQTWCVLTDHEVLFLSERFQGSERFEEARRLSGMAGVLLQSGDNAEALRLARLATRAERRMPLAWEVLIAASWEVGAKARVAALAEATQAFARYPELEVRYGLRLVDEWAAQGQLSLAEAEEMRLLRKHQSERPDLSVELGRRMLARAIERGKPGAAAGTYERVLLLFGRKGGIAVFDEIVGTYLKSLGPRETAARAKALQLARRLLQPERDSQLDQELKALEKALKADTRK